METLDGTDCDVLIVGTGLQQSLLALALSRSDKKILHIDKNAYYGGAEAAFSLQEAEEFVEHVDRDTSPRNTFSDASLPKPPVPEAGAASSQTKLASSRQYTLAMAPQLIYARSPLLQTLVSSKVYRQLDFLAVGSWWVYTSDADQSVLSGSGERGNGEHNARSRLFKVPSGREDIFGDSTLDFKAKRALMKFLRFMADYEQHTEVWEDYRQQPFPDFLTQKFKLPSPLHGPLLALALATSTSSNVTTEYALQRIARHLRSIGMFGAGFGAVLPKWGGMSEIAQVGCRAAAVGGAVYVLGKGLAGRPNGNPTESEDPNRVKVCLKDGETVTARWIAGSEYDLEPILPASPSISEEHQATIFSKSITIVSSALGPLFPSLAEGAPAPAAAVVVFPSGNLVLKEQDGLELPPVYIIVHSADTGECPAGQSVLYASVALNGSKGTQLLTNAVKALLESIDLTEPPNVLWSMQYQQAKETSSSTSSVNTADVASVNEHIMRFPPSSLDLAFNEEILDHVKQVWHKIMGDEAGEFMIFDDREGMASMGDDGDQDP